MPSIIAPVLVAVTLAATFLPATRALESRGWSRTRAAGTISVVLWVVVGVVTVQSIAALAGPIGQALSAAAAGSDKLGAALAPGVSGAPSDTVSSVAASIREVASTIIGSTLGASIFLILSALLAFYMLKDGDHAWAAATSRLSGWRRQEVDIAAHESVTKLGGYMIATGSLGLFNAVTGYIIMVLLGLPLALPVAVLSFFGGFIPYIGQFITSAIAFLVAFAFGSTTDIVIMGIYTAVMNIVQGSVIAPLVYGRAVSLHPAVVLVAIPAGGTLAGILGMFLAVPILGIAAGVWRHLLTAMGSEDPAIQVAAEPATAPTTAAPPVQAAVPAPRPGHETSGPSPARSSCGSSGSASGSRRLRVRLGHRLSGADDRRGAAQQLLRGKVAEQGLEALRVDGLLGDELLGKGVQLVAMVVTSTSVARS